MQRLHAVACLSNIRNRHLRTSIAFICRCSIFFRPLLIICLRNMEQDDYEDSPWNCVSVSPSSSNGFSGAISQSLAAPVGAVDLDKSFLENGGNSLSAISTLLTLKQQGHEISIEDFLQVGSLKTLDNASLSTTISGLSNNLAYRKKPLSDVSSEKAINLLAECFVKKGDLEKSKNMVAEDFAPVIRNAWPHLLKYSFAMLDMKDELVGVAAIADAADLNDLTCAGCHPYVDEVFGYLNDLTARVADHLPPFAQPGVVLSKFLLGTSQHTSPTENVYLMYLMEEEIHKRAKTSHFKSSFAQNTNPLTQQLADFFGCKRLLTDQPALYSNTRGEKPLKHIPESTVVTVDVKDY